MSTSARWMLALSVAAVSAIALSGTSTAGDPRCFGSVADHVLTDGDDDLDLGDETEPQVVVARAGDDSISGGTRADKICGGDGTDAIYAGDGKDKINSGAGRDYVNGENGSDRIKGAGGADGGDTTWRNGQGFGAGLDGDDGDDEILGGGGGDQIRGEGGKDFIRGKGGTDLCDGGGQAGDDVRCEKPLLP